MGTPASKLVVSYSDIQEGYAGIGNLNQDPLFVDLNNGDYRLKAGSPAINTGDPSSTTATVSHQDLDGKPRIVQDRIDMGAYEYAPVNFAITSVSSVSCQQINSSRGEYSLLFSPQYTGQTSDPISFSVVNEMPSTTTPGPYSLRLYTDNPSITLQAQQGTSSTQFTYNWLASCGTIAPADFTIVAVSTVSCGALSGGQRRVTFTPQYAGVDGSPISFSVVNEKVPTTDPGPYSLDLYTDNPTVTLSAQQGATTVTFPYNWLTVCNRATRIGTSEVRVGLQVKVLGNPVEGRSVEVEIRGVTGQAVQLNLVDLQGKLLHQQRLEQAGATERVSVPLGGGKGILLLQVNTATEHQQVKLLTP
jgi:hypothetical protein